MWARERLGSDQPQRTRTSTGPQEQPKLAQYPNLGFVRPDLRPHYVWAYWFSHGNLYWGQPVERISRLNPTAC